MKPLAASIDFPGYPGPPARRKLDVLRYDARAAGWRNHGGESPSQHAGNLRLATFNTWFQGPERETRYRGLLAELRRCEADVVMLQEATAELLEKLLATDWVREGYQVTHGPLRPEAIPSHGVMVLSRMSIAEAVLEPLPTHMGRALLVARAKTETAALTLATVHLESMKPNADVRCRQLDRVFALLEGSPDVLLAGDFNFHDGSAMEEARLDRRYRDLWAELRPGDPGFTQDTEANAMTARAKGETKRVRFDRIFLRDDSIRWRPLSIERLGTRPVAGEERIFPSDHFGLVVELGLV